MNRAMAPEPVTAAPGFERFLSEVAARQLLDWLPDEPVTVLDLSIGCPRLLGLMAELGHRVVHAGNPDADTSNAVSVVDADPRNLDWLSEGCVDAVVAEGGTLSDALAAEVVLDDLFRVLRPGGQLLLAVDSLVNGLAQLADQGRWAELADVPAADVVLVPQTDGRVSRCFWPEELHAMLSGARFSVDWIRPRAVLSQDSVERALRVHPEQLHALVDTELRLSEQRQGESIGAVLVASARKPG